MARRCGPLPLPDDMLSAVAYHNALRTRRRYGTGHAAGDVELQHGVASQVRRDAASAAGHRSHLRMRRADALAGSRRVAQLRCRYGVDRRQPQQGPRSVCLQRLRSAEPFHSNLRHVAPVRISGPVACNLLAVWAQNGSGGVSPKHQLGPLRRALTKYKAFLAERPTIVAGDFNNNVFWHRPGWRINHANAVATLENLG